MTGRALWRRADQCRSSGGAGSRTASFLFRDRASGFRPPSPPAPARSARQPAYILGTRRGGTAWRWTGGSASAAPVWGWSRAEEHAAELTRPMRTAYAVFHVE